MRLSRWHHLTSGCIRKTATTFAVVKDSRSSEVHAVDTERRGLGAGIHFRCIPVLHGTDNFSIFPQQSEVGVLATFDLRLSRPFSHAGSFSRRDCRWFCEPDWAPILSLPSCPPSSPPPRPRHVSIPFACPLSASFLRLRRFFSIDITPSAGFRSRARTEKFRATRQFVRFFCWLLSVLPLLQTVPSHFVSFSLFRSLYSSSSEKRRRTTERRQREFCDRTQRERERGGEGEMSKNHPRNGLGARGRHIDNREYFLAAMCSRYGKRESFSPRGRVLFTPDCV